MYKRILRSNKLCIWVYALHTELIKCPNSLLALLKNQNISDILRDERPESKTAKKREHN